MRGDLKTRLTSREVITAVSGGVAEWLFAVVPLLVVTIVLTHRGEGKHVLESSEWSFGAAVLAGQGLVRFVSGIVRARHLALDRVLLGVSAIFVFVVVPSNIILSLVLIDNENKQPISSLLATGQTGLFFLASVLFIIAAAVSHLWTKRVE